MTTKIFALTITIALFLTQSTMGQNAIQQNDWASVENLSAGVKLQVETKDGKKVKGKLNSASATTLVLASGNKTTTFNKDDIQKIYRRGGGISRTTAALIGAGVGAGVGGGGAAVLLGSTGGSDRGSEVLAIGVLVGAGIGALLGGLAGKSGKRQLIYEAR